MSKGPTPPNFHTDSRSWAERNGFADWALAVMWLIAAFVLFQLAASIVAFLLISSREVAPEAADPMAMLYQNLDLVFVGNSVGQILFLGLATWFFVKLHTNGYGRQHFLRLEVNRDTVSMTGLTVALILVIQPAIWFLSWLNAQMPVPEYFENVQSSQIELIEQFLKGDHVLLLTLFHVGLVPAVCEEILYRGYVMRAFEKSWGIWPAMILSGVLFGLYHVQLTNLLPLAAIGILLAFVTWTSGSLYPAMAAHLVNNGGSVLVGTYYPESAFAELTPETMPPIWAAILSLIVASFLIYLMYKQYKVNTHTGGSNV